MTVKILRGKTDQCNEEILIGTFDDVYHPAVFLKAMLNSAMEDEDKGKFVVEYDFTENWQ